MDSVTEISEEDCEYLLRNSVNLEKLSLRPAEEVRNFINALKEQESQRVEEEEEAMQQYVYTTSSEEDFEESKAEDALKQAEVKVSTTPGLLQEEFCENKTSILINAFHDETPEMKNCDYCQGKRNGGEENLPFFMRGFTSGKMRSDDFQRLLNLGYTRSGNYFYQRNIQKGCCDVYQYRVDVEQFQLNSQQKKAMKRFYRYLANGRTIQNDLKEEEKDEQGLLERLITIGSKFGIDENKISIKSTKGGSHVSNILKLVSENDIRKKLLSQLQDAFGPVRYQNDLAYFQKSQGIVGHSDIEDDVEDLNILDPNYFTHYVKSFIPFDSKGKRPKHKYTIEMHRCKFTQELFELGVKYESSIHKRETVDESFIQSFYCDIPIYNPQNESDAQHPCEPEAVGIDRHRVFKDEGVYPGEGSYHMYHRIDGKLIAVGIIDLTSEILNSAYFIYDPEYRFLNIGVVGAIIEMEYIRMVKQLYNPKLRYYQLGELQVACPKLNYKLNYQGGLVLCPTTFKWISINQALPKIKAINLMTQEQKQQLPYIKLSEDDFPQQIQDEQEDLINPDLIYQGKRKCKVYQLFKPDTSSKIRNVFKSIYQSVGPEMFDSFNFEFKTREEKSEPKGGEGKAEDN
ncbi:hypothetical protein FGO68_gene1509 [Halteria grandinella]|uniref:arginyltransferase n=1 Tax=Halteria grandinella TaxID=5974 RepID=A0A8J8NTC5_HALGN|nr:hypothetical protein FGO68_gene1509 [Halteria grandinella]